MQCHLHVTGVCRFRVLLMSFACGEVCVWVSLYSVKSVDFCRGQPEFGVSLIVVCCMRAFLSVL